MKIINRRRFLSAIISASVLLGICIPENLMPTAQEAENLVFYSVTDYAGLEQDGWISTHSEGGECRTLSGKDFMGYGQYDGKKSQFWQILTDADNQFEFIRSEGSVENEDSFVAGKIAAMTYPANVTDFEFQADVNVHKWHSQIMLTVGAQNPGDWSGNCENAITLFSDYGGNGAYSGTFTLKGACLAETPAKIQAPDNGWKTVKMKVFSRELEVFVDGASACKVKLNNKWQGGKVSFMANGAYARYKEISLKELPAMGTIICHGFDDTDRKVPIYSREDQAKLLPIPTKAGYEFAGYYKDENLTKKLGQDDALYGIEELWVKWERISAAKNCYDETEFTYKNTPAQENEGIAQVTRDVISEGSFIFSQYAQIAKNAGADGSNALCFSQVRGSSAADNAVSYVRVYETQNKQYGFFVPEANARYDVSLSYRIASANRPINFILRKVGEYGSVGMNDGQVVQLNEQPATAGDWVTTEATITTGSTVTALYLAVVTADGTADTDAEVYIDNLIFSLPEIGETYDYETSLGNAADLEKDGWSESFSQEPQESAPFISKSFGTVFNYTGSSVTRKTNNAKYYNYSYQGDWHKPFRNVAALTYAKQKYTYFQLDLDWQLSSSNNVGCPWPIVTFGQPDTDPEMFKKNPISGGYTDPYGGDGAIGVYTEYEGRINICGKNVNETKVNPQTEYTGPYTDWRHITVKVTAGTVRVTVGDLTVTSNLSADYNGGYIALMIANTPSGFRNFKIKSLDSEEINPYTYKNALSNATDLEADGWQESFSTDPQQGTDFTVRPIGTHFDLNGGINRKTTVDYNASFNNQWNKPLRNVAAMTYTARKYTYFVLEVDWKLSAQSDVGSPWPFVTFGQKETTPDVFYKKMYSGYDNPVGDKDVIGVHCEYEGRLNISGSSVSSMQQEPPEQFKGSYAEWRHMTVTVTPGFVTAQVGDNIATTSLNKSYAGGYISLMIANSPSSFRNISITPLEVIDAKQTAGQTVFETELTEEQCKGDLLIATKTLKEHQLKTVSGITRTGKPLVLEEYGSGVYKIQKAEPSRITVIYEKMDLDYDPATTLKYYFDWEEELDDFTAIRAAQPLVNPFTTVPTGDRWSITDGILHKPVIDTSDVAKVDGYSDTNILMLNKYKFRNFELTYQYKNEKVGGFSSGIAFGIQDPAKFCTEEGGGIYCLVESDARGMMKGCDINNVSDDGRWALTEFMIKPWSTNLPGYPQYDTEQIHTMRLRVLDGKAEMFIDGIERPVTALIPKDYYGSIGLCVVNNMGWYDNLIIRPMNEKGEFITLEENLLQSVYNPKDAEEDIWNGDNTEWGAQPAGYIYESNEE